MKQFLKWQLAVFPIHGKRKLTELRRFGMGNVDSKVGEALVECSDDGPAVLFVTNVHADPNGDTFATGQAFFWQNQERR